MVGVGRELCMPLGSRKRAQPHASRIPRVWSPKYSSSHLDMVELPHQLMRTRPYLCQVSSSGAVPRPPSSQQLSLQKGEEMGPSAGSEVSLMTPDCGPSTALA